MPSPFDPKQIDLGIAERWGVRNWSARFPWWGPPSKVRILMYADGPIQLKGGSFLGLQHVFTLLRSHAYFFVDFHVDFAHRDGTDTSATIPGARKLTDPQIDLLNKYDELFLFGFADNGDLDPAEHALIERFMSAPKLGGVLATGDHANLGKRLAGQVKRVGRMRQYPAPVNAPPGWNTTIVEGPDANATYDFDDQSDDTPQRIRPRQYPLAALPLRPRRSRPHPVLCGPDGPIEVLPDHEHEGEALAPTVVAGDPEWPSKNGHQAVPEVIAWGRIKDPGASKYGQEIGLLSAYDGHGVDVGRILADSTWHHWFDINLLGIAPPPSPYSGFVGTPNGQQVLKRLDAFYLNVGVWLAPPSRQAEMRRAAWWSILWSGQIAELPSKAPIWYYGDQAIDALGRYAPRCTVSTWILDLPIFKEKIPPWEWVQLLDRFVVTELPIERFMAGGILNRLNRAFGPAQGSAIPNTAPAAEAMDREIQAGARDGVAELVSSLKADASLAKKLVESRLTVQDALT